MLLVVAFAVAGIAAACGGSASSPAASPETSPTASPRQTGQTAGGGTLVFVKDAGTSTDIYVVNIDGTGLKAVADGPKNESQPAWSPDGAQVAYVVEKGVWVANADGSQERRIATKEVGPGLCWAPGPAIVFSALQAPDVLALVSVKSDGTDLTQVTPAGKPVTLDEHPVWAPDGRIFFNREDVDTSRICSIKPDGSGFSVLRSVPMPTSFSLSPDGKWLLYWDVTRKALVRAPSGGAGEEVVLIDGLDRYFPRTEAVASAWSPDGSMIALTADVTRFVPASPLYVMNADGSGLREVPGAGRGWNATWRP